MRRMIGYQVEISVSADWFFVNRRIESEELQGGMSLLGSKLSVIRSRNCLHIMEPGRFMTMLHLRFSQRQLLECDAMHYCGS
jgi:hypothetical protein